MAPVDITRSLTLRGFSLLEVLVALAVFALAVTSMVTLLSRHAFLERHLDAHLQVLRSLEAQNEALRGGLPLTLEEGVQVLDPVLPPAAPVDAFALRVQIRALVPEGYWSVTLVADYRVGRAHFTRTLEGRFWRP